MGSSVTNFSRLFFGEEGPYLIIFFSSKIVKGSHVLVEVSILVRAVIWHSLMRHSFNPLIQQNITVLCKQEYNMIVKNGDFGPQLPKHKTSLVTY